MQKTDHRARLLHLSMTGKILCLVLSLLIITAISARAGEPAMILAMADQQPPAESQVSVTTSAPVAPESSIAEATNNLPATDRPAIEATTEFTTELRLEKSAASGQADGLQLVHKSLSASSGSNLAFSVQAGYGRIWDEHSMLSKLSAGHQETGCAYVGAKISF